jgi:hypothetical protein
MKPAVSLIPEPDRSTEDRKPLTKKQRAELALRQRGLCGCGCGGKLDHPGEGTRDEHLQALELLGSNDLANRSLWRKPCSDAKTYGADLPAIAKAKRQGGEKGQRARREKRGGGSIKSKGFGSVSRGFDGMVKLTAKARRAAAVNDDAPTLSSARSGRGG